MEATDVLAADTVPADTEAPAEPTQDTAEVEATEGTDTGEQATDTRDFDAEKAEAVEAARNEAREEARKSFEEEAVLRTYRERQKSQAAWLANQSGEAVKKHAEWLVAEVETAMNNGRPVSQVLASIKSENLARGWAGQLAAAVQSEQLMTAYQLQDDNLKRSYPDWRVPTDLQRQKEQAIAQGDTVKLYTVRDEIWRRAVLENEAPKEARKLAAEEAAKNKKAADVEKVREGDKARAQTERPTAVSGGAAGVSITSINDAAKAYNAGSLTGAEYAKYVKQFGGSID